MDCVTRKLAFLQVIAYRIVGRFEVFKRLGDYNDFVCFIFKHIP